MNEPTPGELMCAYRVHLKNREAGTTREALAKKFPQKSEEDIQGIICSLAAWDLWKEKENA